MNYRQSFRIILFSLLVSQILFSPMAHAADSEGISKFVSDHGQAIAVTVTVSLIALLAAFIFVVGAEKIARKVYELLKTALTDPTGRSVIVAVFIIIAMGVGFGLYNSRIFEKLTDSGYARGVITYLITVATIGLVFVLVLQIMFVEDESLERIKGAREVLAILTGILGTIVGFYFGQTNDQARALRIAHLAISQLEDGTERVTAFVEGGVPPYNYVMTFGDNKEYTDKKGPSNTGIIVEDIKVTKPTDVNMSVVDTHNNTDERREAAPKVDASGTGSSTSPPGGSEPSPKTN